MICDGFSARSETSKNLRHDDTLEASKDSTPSPPSSSASSSIAAKPVKSTDPAKPSASQSRFRSDQLVSRMKQFFQGSGDRSGISGSRRSQSPEARRSVNNRYKWKNRLPRKHRSFPQKHSFPVVDVIKVFLEELCISPKFRIWKKFVLMSEPALYCENNAIFKLIFILKCILLLKWPFLNVAT